MFAIDNSTSTQPLPRINYVEECVAEDNPWRKLFQSGTAGATTEFFCVERLSKGATYQFLRLDKRNTPSINAAPQSDVEILISLLKPSMSQLAAAFGVSRQRIYDWRKGDGMSISNTELMSELLVAARVINQHSSHPDQVTNRKIIGGKSFWDAISSGTSPSEAISALLTIIDRDESERAILKKSLASQKFSLVKEPPLFSAYLSE